MHQEYADVLELKFDDGAMDAGIEVVEALARHMRRRQKSVRLLAYDWHELIKRAAAILAFVGRIMADLRCDMLGLIDHARAHRPGIHLDETYDVGLLRADEFGDAAQHFSVATQIAGAWQRQVKGRPGAGCIADVVKKQAQWRAVGAQAGVMGYSI